MSAGYTFTTLSARRGEPVRVGVSFYLDDLAWLVVTGTDSDSPHLTVQHGEVQVTIGPAVPGVVTSDDARIARSLADRAAEYAATVERIAAEHEDRLRSAPEPGGSAA